MGEHKHNPTAIAAKNGELPPKQKPLGKREARRIAEARLQEILYKPLVEAYLRMEQEVDDG